MLPSAHPEVDLHEQSPLNLAFVGDGVYELLVRQRLVERTRMQPGALHAAAVRYVSARGQCQALELLKDQLSGEELGVLRRGQNASKATVSKHATAQQYRASTGVEALFGWLYLRGENARIQQLFELVWQGLEQIAPPETSAQPKP